MFPQLDTQMSKTKNKKQILKLFYTRVLLNLENSLHALAQNMTIN